MKFVFVETMDDVLNAALEAPKPSSHEDGAEEAGEIIEEEQEEMAKVLLAEDDQTMVGLLTTLLQMDGFEVNGSGCRRRYCRRRWRDISPEVLVLDVHLSSQNGLDVLEAIRKRRSETTRCA